MADIRDACGEIAAITLLRQTPGIPPAVLTRAVERLLEIIGEAATALPEPVRARYPQVPWRDITRLRVVLAHHYQRIDPAQVWAIVDDEIPPLTRALQAPNDAGQDL